MAQSDQVPVDHNFHATSTAAEVLAGVDLSGKTAVVTGGYSGIGLETVRGLTDSGASVIVPVRSPEKAAEALAGIDGDVTTVPMDLADIGSIRDAATSLNDRLSTLDLLINNAGIMACPEARVGPGWESQFGICHMGHFAFTNALMPLLAATPGARTVSLSSTAHKMSGINWDDVNYDDQPYDKWQAYGQAKTANALFINALSRRMADHGGLAFSVHPGGIFTPLQRHLSTEEMVMLGWLDEDGEPSELAKAGFKTPEQGASTTLWAATSAELVGVAGVYCEDCNISAPTDPNSPTARYIGVDPHACDDDQAERLWELSEQWLASA